MEQNAFYGVQSTAGTVQLKRGCRYIRHRPFTDGAAEHWMDRRNRFSRNGKGDEPHGWNRWKKGGMGWIPESREPDRICTGLSIRNGNRGKGSCQRENSGGKHRRGSCEHFTGRGDRIKMLDNRGGGNPWNDSHRREIRNGNRKGIHRGEISGVRAYRGTRNHTFYSGETVWTHQTRAAP